PLRWAGQRGRCLPSYAILIAHLLVSAGAAKRFLQLQLAQGWMICSLPSSLLTTIELLTPSAVRVIHVFCVPVGPATLTPDESSEAPTFTEGRPRSVINRSRTVSADWSPAGNTLRLARTRPASSTI